MLESALYEYLRNIYLRVNAPFDRPITKDFIVHLIGYHGLNVLTQAKFIEPIGHSDQYILSCEV